MRATAKKAAGVPREADSPAQPETKVAASLPFVPRSVKRPPHPDLDPGVLLPLPGGWRFEREGRQYRLTGDPPAARRDLYDVEARVGGRSWWRTVDLEMSYSREGLAREVAGDDRRLSRAVCDDLTFAWLALKRIRINFEIEQKPLRTAPELLIGELSDRAADELARRARELGGRVFRRRRLVP